MKKKFLAMLMASVMMLSLGGCGDSGDDKKSKSESEETKTEAEKEENEENDTETTVSGEVLETDVLTLNYDSDVWNYNEEYTYMDETYACVYLDIPEGDSYITSVQIDVSIENHESFRDYLDIYEFDAYEYVVNDAYDLVNIGGIDCLLYEGESWGEPYVKYIGRWESASTTVSIQIMGDYENECVGELLDGLTICTEDIGNVDAPWPWEGEAFSASQGSASVGEYTVNSEWLPIAECIITGETFNHSVAATEDKVFILGDGTLKQYSYDGSSLTFDSEISCGEDYTYVQATDDGSVWISGFGYSLMCIKDGVEVATYDEVDYVYMSPSGEWGIDWFSGPECEKITIADGSITSTPITFAEVSTISSVTVDDNYIYVCGSDATDDTHKAFVYDTDGVLQMTLTDVDGEGLGCITFMAQTSNGFIGLDGNMREVVLWSADGTCIGVLDDADLFSTNYPWFCGGTVLSDGSILTIMTEDRADESAMEVVAFRLSGF